MALFGKKEKEKEKKQEKEVQEANITLYSCGNDPLKIQSAAEGIFRGNAAEVVPDTEDRFRVRLQDGSFLTFTVVTDAEELRMQTNGMANFFARAPLANEQVKKGCIRQILLFDCIIGIVFPVDGREDRTGYIMDRLNDLAGQLHAFTLYPNMHLFAPDGRLLVSMDGMTDFDEFYPIAGSAMFDREETDADRERRERSLKILKAKGIPYIEHMKVSAYEAECAVPSKEEAVRRLAALFAVCVKSEIYTCGEYGDCEEKTKEVLGRLQELYRYDGALSGEEKAYLEDVSPDSSAHSKFNWRYEGCAVLLWALSLLELKPPVEYCDAAEIGAILWNHDFAGLMGQAVLRDRKEIMDMQDLVYRYDWACVEARIKRQEISGLDGEIIYEWHYALNWLTSVDGITDWDEVSPRT